MYRLLRVSSSIVLLTAAFCVAIINFSRAVTVLSVAVGVVGLHLLFLSTRGLHTGYMETLNGTFGAALETISGLIRIARKNVRMVSGQLSPAFYFHEKIFTELRDAINRGVKIEIILGEPDTTRDKLQSSAPHCEWQEFLSWLDEGKVTLRRTPFRIRQHFILVDGVHVRVEEPHAKVKNLAAPAGRRAETIYFDERAETYATRFSELAERAAPV